MSEEEDLRAANVRLETEHRLRESLDRERTKSDEIYALKLVERIVFGLLAFVLFAVVGAVLALVIR